MKTNFPTTSISLIIPAFNEEARIGVFLDSIERFISKNEGLIYEVIVVDDGSTDGTSEVVSSFQSRMDELKLVKLFENRGKGAAVREGINAAKADWVVFMDADGATPITELPKMAAVLVKGDIGVGNRWMTGAKTQRNSRLRKLSGWIYRKYMGLFGLGMIDTMCGFKGYRRKIAVDLFNGLIEERWLFDTEIAYKAVRRGCKIINFPINWTSQDGSKLDTKTLLRSALGIWPLIRRIRNNEWE